MVRVYQDITERKRLRRTSASSEDGKRSADSPAESPTTSTTCSRSSEEMRIFSVLLRPVGRDRRICWTTFDSRLIALPPLSGNCSCSADVSRRPEIVDLTSVVSRLAGISSRPLENDTVETRLATGPVTARVDNSHWSRSS